jgi:hypothetical protein
MNWKAILSNLKEAGEQIDDLVSSIESGDPPNEEAFQIFLRHAYHHLNFAWNVRHVDADRYSSMTDTDFEEWGKYSSDVEDLDD